MDNKIQVIQIGQTDDLQHIDPLDAELIQALLQADNADQLEDPIPCEEQHYNEIKYPSDASDEQIYYYISQSIDNNRFEETKQLLQQYEIKQGYFSDLLCIAVGKSLQFAELMVEAGADVNFANCDENMPLMIAANSGTAEVVKYLIQMGADVNAADRAGMRPIDWCVHNTDEKEQFAILQELVRHGADVNTTDYGDNQNVLMRYIRHTNNTLVSYLIHMGADVNHVDQIGDNCLIKHALSNSSKEIFDALIKAGANYNHHNNANHTALYYYEQNVNASNISEEVRAIKLYCIARLKSLENA
jgi:ankyrin repeat protein